MAITSYKWPFNCEEKRFLFMGLFHDMMPKVNKYNWDLNDPNDI